MELYSLAKGAYYYYRSSCKGNSEITYDMARKKLTRNILLARFIPPRNEQEESDGKEMYFYGNLQILVKNDEIVYIMNSDQKCPGWTKNVELYNELNRILGIPDEHSEEAA